MADLSDYVLSTFVLAVVAVVTYFSGVESGLPVAAGVLTFVILTAD